MSDDEYTPTTEKVPAEAIEAAARALWDADEDPEPREHYSWSYLTDHAKLWPDNYGPIRDGYLAKARAALTAALPHLAAHDAEVARAARVLPSAEDVKIEANRRWPLTGDDLDVLDKPLIEAFIAGAIWAGHGETRESER